jgi:hypothetical protein
MLALRSVLRASQRELTWSSVSLLLPVKSEIFCFHAGFMLGIFFRPEDGGETSVNFQRGLGPGYLTPHFRIRSSASQASAFR